MNLNDGFASKPHLTDSTTDNIHPTYLIPLNINGG